MKTLILVTALAASTVAADAQTYRTTVQRVGSQWTVSTYRSEPAPSVILVPKPTDAEDRARIERIAAWEQRCKPTMGPPDANGIRRYVYAAPNCDTGN